MTESVAGILWFLVGVISFCILFPILHAQISKLFVEDDQPAPRHRSKRKTK